MALLTDQIFATGVSLNDLIHIVVTGDTSQNPAGSSFKASLNQVASLISGSSGASGTSGSSGASGTSGSSGNSGTSGSSGNSGTSGSSGNSGTSGSSGANGVDGTSGSSGISGTSGSSGANGVDGTSGSSGISGTSGSSGANGVDGTSGSSGISGTSGSSGNSGTSGSSGANGVDGTSGSSGISGTSGSSGANGVDGTSGSSGNSGTSGSSGSSGTNGVSGTSGTSGESGTSGINGISSGLVYYYDGPSATQTVPIGSLITDDLLLSPNLGTQTTIVTSNFDPADGDTKIVQYVSPATSLDTVTIIPGLWVSNLFAQRTLGTGTLVYWIVIDEMASDGTTLIGNIATGSASSGTAITNTQNNYIYTEFVPSYVLASVNSRIRVSIYANTTGNNTSFTIEMRDSTLSNIVTTLAANIAGTSGTSGSSGANGVDGTSGSSGANGVDGTSGSSGANGVDGTSGSSGANGIDGTSGSSGTSGVGVLNYYASYSDSTTQTVSGSNIPTVITYNTTEIQNGFTLVSGSQITAQYNGIYEFSYSLQIEKTQGGSAVDVDIFVRKNGTDIVRTDSILGLNSNSIKQLPFVSIIVDMNQNDYLELVFASSSSDIQITAVPLSTSPYNHPAAPSIIVNIKNIGVAAVAYTSTSGSSGSSGTNGTSGSSGISGTSGSSGISGTSGSSGISGTSGSSGISGTSGSSGSSGSSGTSGSSGSSGTSGSSGISGTSGTSGERGTNGTSGTTPLPSQVDTVTNSNSGKFFPTFVDSDNPSATQESLYTDAGLSYDPSTNILEITASVRSGDGSVSAPSHSFIGDTNTGMYRIGTDNLGFATAGSRRMSINSTGSVLMGNGDETTGANFIFPIGGQNTTSNATPATLITLATVSDSIYTIEAFVVGGLVTASSCIGGVITATFVNDGGTLRIIGTVQGTVQEDFAGSPTFTLTTSGTNIILQVTGVAATTINWYGKIQYLVGSLGI